MSAKVLQMPANMVAVNTRSGLILLLAKQVKDLCRMAATNLPSIELVALSDTLCSFFERVSDSEALPAILETSYWQVPLLLEVPLALVPWQKQAEWAAMKISRRPSPRSSVGGDFEPFIPDSRVSVRILLNVALPYNSPRRRPLSVAGGLALAFHYPERVTNGFGITAVGLAGEAVIGGHIPVMFITSTDRPTIDLTEFRRALFPNFVRGQDKLYASCQNIVGALTVP